MIVTDHLWDFSVQDGQLYLFVDGEEVKLHRDAGLMLRLPVSVEQVFGP